MTKDGSFNENTDIPADQRNSYALAKATFLETMEVIHQLPTLDKMVRGIDALYEATRKAGVPVSVIKAWVLEGLGVKDFEDQEPLQ